MRSPLVLTLKVPLTAVTIGLSFAPCMASADEAMTSLTRASFAGVSAYDPGDLIGFVTQRIFARGAKFTAENVSDAIELMYREDGFPLAEVTAVRPTAAEPIVFHVVEGRVAEITITGLDPKTADRVRAYVAPVLKSDPLRQSVLERSLALSSDLSGVALASQIDHPDGLAGARLSITGSQRRGSGAAGMEIVPLRPGSAVRAFAVQEFYSLASGGDLVRILGQATLDRGKDWSASGLVYYRTPVGGNGTYIEVLGGNTVARRELGTVSQDSRLTGWNAVLVAGHPIQRSLTDFTYLLGEYEYISARSRFLGAKLASSAHALRFRALKGRDMADSGQIRSAFTVSFGQRPATRPGQFDDGAKTFAHIRSEIGLSVPLDQYQKTALRVEFRGQWAGARLPGVERIALGHAPFLRGYAPAEVVGDRGWGATAQLGRKVTSLSSSGVEVIPFAFGSVGQARILKPRVGERPASTIASVGAGSDFHLQGNLRLSGWMALPLRTGPQSRSGNPAFHVSATVGW